MGEYAMLERNKGSDEKVNIGQNSRNRNKQTFESSFSIAQCPGKQVCSKKMGEGVNKDHQNMVSEKNCLVFLTVVLLGTHTGCLATVLVVNHTLGVICFVANPRDFLWVFVHSGSIHLRSCGPHFPRFCK